jgi:hypothetical protein
MYTSFSSILHCTYHHHCCLFSYRHAFTLCVFLAPTCTPIVFPPSIPYHLVSLWLPYGDCCIFKFPRVLTSTYTCFSRDFCFHVVFTCFNIMCFDITCFNISFAHKRLGYLPQTRPRADCCTSWELVPALLQPHVGRFFLCFCIAPRAASPFFSCLQARPRADCCTPDTWQFDFFTIVPFTLSILLTILV